METLNLTKLQEKRNCQMSLNDRENSYNSFEYLRVPAKAFFPEKVDEIPKRSSGTSIILPADALKAVSWERRDPASASRRKPTYVSFKRGGHIVVATFPAEKVLPLRGTTEEERKASFASRLSPGIVRLSDADTEFTSTR